MIRKEEEGKFIFFLNEFMEIYEEVKISVLTAENLDNNSKTYVAILIELRNALDHIMRAVHSDKNTDKELSDAKDHLYRAGYDAFEILAVNVSYSMINDLKDLDPDAIAHEFEEYYNRIRPELMDIKVQLAEIRSDRENPNDSKKVFTEYSKRIKILITDAQKVKEYIPLIIKYQNSQKKKKRKDRIYNLLVGVIVGIIVTIVTLFITGVFTPDAGSAKDQPIQEINK